MTEFVVIIDFKVIGRKSVLEEVEKCLKGEGFKTNTYINEKLVKLPAGCFSIETNQPTSQIIFSIKETLSNIKHDFSIMVIDVKALDGFNLVPSYSAKLRK